MAETDLENFPTDAIACEMLRMVSPVYDKSYVGKWLYQVLGAGLEEASGTIKALRQEAFPETATEKTLPLWEELYGIIPAAGVSVEERRSTVLRKRSLTHAATPAWIKQYLESLTGRTCTVTEDAASYAFAVDIGAGSSAYDVLDVIREIEKIKPAHMSYSVSPEPRNLFINTLNPTNNLLPAVVGQTSFTATGGTAAAALHGIRITARAGAKPGATWGNASTAAPTLMGLAPGKTYTWSADGKWKLASAYEAVEGLATQYLRIYLYALAEGAETYTPYLKNLMAFSAETAGTEINQRVEYTFTVPANAIGAHLRIGMSGNTPSTWFSATDYIEINNIMLVEGSEPMPWVPAPEDVAEAIKKRKGRG